MLQNSSNSTEAKKTDFVTIGRIQEFSELQPRTFELGKTSVGVVLFKGQFYAYRNSCPHQEGPALEGVIAGKTECEVFEGGNRREFVSKERFNIVCPWHGVEYDLQSGICRADDRMKLRKIEVITENGDVRLRSI